jgi:excisionase family DNA binding protein
MNIRKFLRDFRTGRSDYSSAEAAAYLGIKHETFRQLVRAGVIQPLDGGGRGRSFYFSHEQLIKLAEQIAMYR